MSQQKRLLQLLEEVKTALKEEKVHQSKKRTTGNSYSSDLGLGGIIDDKRARLIKTIIEKIFRNFIEAISVFHRRNFP